MKPVTKNGVLYLSEPQEHGFEKAYLSLREKENRLLSDSQVAKLPYLVNHALEKEWKLRQESTERVLNYFKDKELVNVFEIGAGNGWFSNQLSLAIPNATVYAIDVNAKELEQCANVFSKNKNIKPVYWNIFDKQTFLPKPGLIVFNASIQYFPSLKQIILRSFEVMKAYGEIHIIDSPIYAQNKAIEAIERSENYYKSQGFPEVSKFYFHHTFEELEKFNHKVLYQPSVLAKILGKGKSPFPWIRISKY